MKAVKLNKKLWTDAVLDELDAVTPACARPLLEGCGSGCGCCGGGCCCAYQCRVLIC